MDWDLWIERRIFELNPNETIVGFSNDGGKALVSFDRYVFVVDVATGSRLNVLRHQATVVGFFFDGSKEALTYTSTGTECVWDTGSWTILLSRETAININSIWKFDNDTLGVSINSDNRLFVWKIAKMNAENETILQTASHTIKRSQYAVTNIYLVCCEKLFVYLYIYGEAKSQRFKYTGKAEFMDHAYLEFNSVVASGSTVAASLSFGRVFIWKNVPKNGIASFSQSVHWHKWSPCLALTGHGSLMSAGVECAIAKFSLAAAKNVAKPQLLPHLQTSVVSLHSSQDGSRFAAVLADNSLHFVPSATMNILSSMPCVLRSPRYSLLPLLTDPLYPEYVVDIARPGVIQWLDPSISATVIKADISRENPVEGDSIFADSTGYTDVCAAAFTNTMAVTCVRHVNLDVPNNRIQFWRRHAGGKKLALDYETLNGDTEVVFARACLDFDSFLLVDSKGVISTWQRVENDDKRWHRAYKTHWLNILVLQITRIRSFHFAAIHKISDAEGIVGIWKIDYDKPLCLVHKYQGDCRPTDVEWCGTSSHFLLIASNKYICAFSINSLSPLWIACEPNLHIAVSSQYAVAYSNDTVYVVNDKSGTPLCRRKIDKNIKYVVGIRNDASFTIVFTTDKTYGMLSCKDTEIRTAEASVKKALKRAFSSLMPINQEEQPMELISAEGAIDISLLSGPAYALAPLPLLAERFICSCLLPKRSSQ